MQKGRGFSRVLLAGANEPISGPLALCWLLSGGSLFWGRFHRFFWGLDGWRSDGIYACFSRKNSAHRFERVSPRSSRFRTIPHHVSLVAGVALSLVPDKDVVSGVHRAPDALHAHRGAPHVCPLHQPRVLLLVLQYARPCIVPTRDRGPRSGRLESSARCVEDD